MKKIYLVASLLIPFYTFGAIYTDNFQASHDYLANGVAGTIWDGFIYNVNGGSCNVTTADANISNANELTLASDDGNWEGSGDDGVFLYKSVTGDFDASVRVVGADTPVYNDMGLMARQGGVDSSHENYIAARYFAAGGYNSTRNTVNSSSSDADQSGLQPWLRLTRVGNVFTTYRSTDGRNWTQMTAVARNDLNGVTMRVGLWEATFSGNTGTVQFDNFQLLVPVSTTTLLNSSQNPIAYGGNVTFTATIQTNGFTAGNANGTVEFLDGTTTLGSVAVTNGQANLTTSQLLPGTHTIRAQYSGDVHYIASSNSVSQQVTSSLPLTTTVLTTSSNPSVAGNSLQITASVQTNGFLAGNAGGSVIFKDGGVPFSTNAVVSGQASFITSALAIGEHDLTALYSGDSNYAPSLSDVTAQLVVLTTNDAYSLENNFIRVDLNGSGITNIYDKSSSNNYPFSQDEFYLSLGSDVISSTNFTLFIEQQSATNRTYLLDYGQWIVLVNYELEPDWHFISKQISITTAATNDFMLHQIQPLISILGAPVSATQSVNSGQLLRFNDGGSTPASHGLFAELQTAPQYANVSISGQQLDASYAPEMVWNMSWGAFKSDRVLLGPYTLTGVTYPTTQVGEWQYIPEGTPVGGPTIDRAELDALVNCQSAFLSCHPTNSTRVQVGWCENDFQIDVGTASGQAEYKRILDQASAVGCKYALYAPANSLLSSVSADTDSWGWENLLWLALGQQIRTNAWYPGSNAVPSSVQTMLDYAQSDNLKLLAYVYPSLPFEQNPEWTAGTGVADTGQRSFQDWWLNLLVNFYDATGIGGYSFDYWFINNSSAPSSLYAQWYGCRRIMQELRRRIPDIVMDGRQSSDIYGAWTWLSLTYPGPLHSDEQPGSFQAFPDLHWDRVSADRQRWAAWWYRVHNFCPLETLPGFVSHQTERHDAAGNLHRTDFRIRDWDCLGWRYSVISAVGTAPFNYVVGDIPAKDTNEVNAFLAAGDQKWMRGWFDWSDQNLDVLRNLHPIINQPELGRVDGTAAFKNGHGFVFLFNPNYRVLTANFTLDNSIGLTNGGPFIMRQLYPDAEKGKLILPPTGTFWNLGESVSLPMPGADALVLEITNAPVITRPLVLGVKGSATLASGQLALTNVVGQVGTHYNFQVLIPDGALVTNVMVDGLPVAFHQNGNTIDASMDFEGTAFPRLPQIGSYDPDFTGGVYSAQITIPSAVFDQLAARKKAWPVPYTADDLLATWLGSYRLLLFVDVAAPSQSMSVSLKIDGQPVTLTPAYTTIYNRGVSSAFVGWYADVSSLAPDVPHQFDLTLPSLAAGQFQGMFLDNVEAAFTNQIKSADTVSDNFDTGHDYLTQGVAGTIWEGIYTKAGDIPNTGLGSDGPGSTLVADANITSNGVLTVQSTNTDWENAADDGFFLFKNVTGDFKAQVHVTRLDAVSYNFAGLMARVADIANASPGEDYVDWCAFNQSGFENYCRSVTGGTTTNMPIGGGATTNTYLMLERTGDTFNCYQRGSLSAPWQLMTNVYRPDLHGLPLQVGIMQACFSGNTPVAQFDGFSLQTPALIAASAPAPASGLMIANGASDKATIAWTPGSGSSGSLVIMRANGPITAQPSLGVNYVASPVFGVGDDLGNNNYAVYAGTGNQVTVTGLTPGVSYSVAVYAYNLAGGDPQYALDGADTANFTKQTLQSLSLELEPAIPAGGSRQAIVKAVFSGGVTQDVTASSVFQSSAPAVASVNTNGVVSGLMQGWAAITASYGGTTNVMNIVVQPFVLTHRYSFTNDASDSIGGANGILEGGAIISNGQLVLNGASGTYVDLPNGLVTNYDSISIECWVTDNGSGDWARIFDFGNSANGESQQGGSVQDMMLSLPSGYGNLRGSYTVTGGGSGEQVLEWPSGGRPVDGQESQIAWVTDGRAHTGRLYVNGDLVGQNDAMTLTPAGLGPTLNDWIGKSQFSRDPYFNGTIDEFRIYEGVLSAQQIETNYLAGPNVLSVLPPLLKAQIASTNLIVSWSATESGFSLTSTSNLNTSAVWSSVNAPISKSNGLFQTALPLSHNGTVFYHLQK